MTLALLWTDIMVWFLVVSLSLWGRVVARSPQIREQWHMIFRSKVAMVSAIVLLFYLAIALLDSVHLRLSAAPEEAVQNDTIHYQGEMVSLLDMIFSHTADRTERTYSEPFATQEYAKSIVVNENGVTKQVHLPLKYVGTGDDIASRSIPALLAGMLGGGSLIALHMLWRRRRGWKSELPWRTAYLTLLILVMTFTWLYLLSHHYHVLGTDKVGGDVLYQSLKSIRTGVLIGVLTTLVMLPVAVILGVSAGLFGGRVDDAIQYLYTTLSSIPGVLLIAAGILVMQVMMDNNPGWFESTMERSDMRLLFLILILGITSWTGLCRVIRAETLKISRVEFVTAAKAFGVGKFTIIRRHIIPNLMHIILISVVLDFSGLVLAEAVLSYVGVGVDPTMYSWGNMINQARLEMAREPMVWWSLFSAFVFMFVLVLAANLLSDRIQTVLDPRNRV